MIVVLSLKATPHAFKKELNSRLTLTLNLTLNLSLQMVKQLDSFKNFLETFAAKHQSDIKKNPEFRQHFQKLCSQIGVDPLACKLSTCMYIIWKQLNRYWFELSKIRETSHSVVCARSDCGFCGSHFLLPFSSRTLLFLQNSFSFFSFFFSFHYF